MEPRRAWGTPLWLTIHVMALSAPYTLTADDRAYYELFYTQDVPNSIPCADCRAHYRTHLARLPLGPRLGSRQSLFEWTVDLHNRVNASLGKPTYTYEQALGLFGQTEP